MIYKLSGSVLSANVPSGNSDAVAELGFASPPSNQEILDASKKAYSQYQPAVDSMTIALTNIIKTQSMRSEIEHLDGINWQSSGIDSSVVNPFYNSVDVQGAIYAARQFPQLHSFSVGAFSNKLPNNEVGMIGFARNLTGSPTTGITLTLDIFKNLVSTDVGSNLQFGEWLGTSDTLHDNVIGMYISTQVNDTSINLKILLTKTLQPYGFVVSSGATLRLPVSNGVFAGATAIWGKG